MIHAGEDSDTLYYIVKGSVAVLIKDEEGSISAIYATLPVKAVVAGKETIVCQSLDTMTDENHRGKGLFVTAAKERYSLSKSEGVGFVYGFPNGNSVHGFRKHLEWKLLDPVPFIFKPIRTGYFLRKVLGDKIGSFFDVRVSIKSKIKLSGRHKLVKTTVFDGKYDQLWSVFSQKFSVSVLRDSSYLNWRFIDKPNEDYKIYSLFEGDILRGFIVYCIKVKHGGNVGYVMELITDLSCVNHQQTLLDYATNDLIDLGCDVILAWCFPFSPSFDAYSKANFFSLPKKLRPIELHFGYANFNSDETVLSKRYNWYLSYSDSDTV